MIYYKYDRDGFYAGTIESDERPMNVSTFAPNPTPEGFRSWFDGIGWRMVPDLASETRSLEESKELLYDALSSVRYIDTSNSNYSIAERATFDAQYQEAIAISGGKEAGPYITAIAKATKESIQDIATKILVHRERADAKEAAFAAHLQQIRNRIKKAKSVKELPTLAEIEKLRNQ